MPINQRISEHDYTPSKADDARGVIDPTGPVYEGSYLDRLGVDPTNSASASRMIAFAHAEPPLPTEMPVQDLLVNLRAMNNPGYNIEATYRNRIRSPLTAIRAFCVLCKDGPKAAANCDKVECPLWPFRMGKNSLRSR